MTATNSTTHQAVGWLVVNPAVDGIARVAAVDGDTLTLECFESIAKPSVGHIEVLRFDTKRVHLARQTRVFVLDASTGHWRAGRVVGGERPAYFVRFPNTQTDSIVDEKDLR